RSTSAHSPSSLYIGPEADDPGGHLGLAGIELEALWGLFHGALVVFKEERRLAPRCPERRRRDERDDAGGIGLRGGRNSPANGAFWPVTTPG
ncbi:MAG: hypothetical protein U5J83_02020, partial [Bryobacterales bacterium]|nr:hypothetical protein [Bryobacterales bacterium]